MYTGELRLGVLALTELILRPTAQGLTLEAKALCKKSDGIGPVGVLPYHRSTTWSRELVEAATALVLKVEQEMGESLGPGSTVAEPVTEEPGDLASSLAKKGGMPNQF